MYEYDLTLICVLVSKEHSHFVLKTLTDALVSTDSNRVKYISNRFRHMLTRYVESALSVKHLNKCTCENLAFVVFSRYVCDIIKKL